jgi:hypothetical protein
MKCNCELEKEIPKVRFLDINVTAMETTVRFHDHPNCIIYSKTFYTYRNGAFSLEDVIEYALAIQSKYGIDQVWVNEDGAGRIVADHLTKCHTRFGFALYKYKDRALVL